MTEQPFPKALPKAKVDLTHCERLPIHWVYNDDDLYDLIEIIDSIDRVALDTEFVRRTTLYPILAVVQVNTGDAIYLLDAPKLDLTEFWQALAEIPQMIWYACGEDLTIFYQMSGCPPLTNVVDVQIGVGYLGQRPQMGFALVLEQMLGIQLNKAEQASDWLKRPLSNEQERYASDDVRYLFILADFVEQTLKERGFDGFASEDCLSYAKEIYDNLHQTDERLHLDYLHPTYNRHQVAVLNSLLSWRNAIANRLNRPLGNYFNRQVLKEIVQAMPVSVYELSKTTIHRKTLGNFGKEIVSIIKEIKGLDEKSLPNLPTLYYLNDKNASKEIKACLTKQAQMLGIPDGVFFRSKWLDSVFLAVANEDESLLCKELQGHRKAWVAAVLMPLVAAYRHKLQAYGIPSSELDN